MIFKDKNGKTLRHGDVIKIDDSIVDIIYEYEDSCNMQMFGVNATNPDWYERNDYGYVKYYPMLDFDMNYVEIIGNIIENKEDIKLVPERTLRMARVILGDKIGD